MNNPPAFPIVIDLGDGVKYQTGMTLRDYMAARAMQSFLVDQCHDAGQWDLDAKAAYKVADAMLKAREE
jgi:hypothetical protein